MARLYTRIQRKFGITSSRNHGRRNVPKKKGDKTFSTEEKAKTHATTVLKLSEGKFSIVPAKKNKRFKIVT